MQHQTDATSEIKSQSRSVLINWHKFAYLCRFRLKYFPKSQSDLCQKPPPFNSTKGKMKEAKTVRLAVARHVQCFLAVITLDTYQGGHIGKDTRK